MKESAFQKWIVDTFRAYGWIVKHVPTPMRPVSNGRFVPDPRGRGLLDLLLIHPDPPRLIWAEVKAADGELSDDQKEMIALLRAVVERVRDRFAPEPSPLGVFLFAPGSEALIAALARGAAVNA